MNKKYAKKVKERCVRSVKPTAFFLLFGFVLQNPRLKSPKTRNKKLYARIKVPPFSMSPENTWNDLSLPQFNGLEENGLKLKTKLKNKHASYKFIGKTHGNLDLVERRKYRHKENEQQQPTTKKSWTLVFRLAIRKSPMFFLSGKFSMISPQKRRNFFVFFRYFLMCVIIAVWKMFRFGLQFFGMWVCLCSSWFCSSRSWNSAKNIRSIYIN